MMTQVTLTAPAALGPDSAGLPPGLEERLRDVIGEQWGVHADRVVLAANNVPEWLDSETPFLLRADGNGAHVVATFRPRSSAPVTLALRVGVRQNVSIARRRLRAGDVLDTADVWLRERTVWTRPEREQGVALPGWLVRASIPAGHPVVPPAAVPPLDVLAGSRVDLVWRKGPIEITVGGVAMNAGRVGQTIHVRLDNQRGRARATVLGPGRALLES